MPEERRRVRRLENRVTVYFKKIDEKDVNECLSDIYETVDNSESFSFLMSLNKLDSSFGDLNKAFVLMMKEMDAKLNYIIDMLRDKEYEKRFEGFEKTYSCDISTMGMSFISDKDLKEKDKIYIKFFLPVASHSAIKTIARIIRKTAVKDGKICYGCEFLNINKNSIELLIHYMFFVERKYIKNRKLNEY